MKPMASRSRRIAVASLFGVLVWIILGFLPAPTSDYFIAVEACLLALSFLVVGRGGATYVGAVSGLLISVVKRPSSPLTSSSRSSSASWSTPSAWGSARRKWEKQELAGS